MIPPIKQEVVVKEAGRLEILSAEFRPGIILEVTIQEKPAEPEMPVPKWASIMGSCKGMFQSAAEIDRFIDEERDGWEERLAQLARCAMPWRERIVADPNVCGGQPCITGTNIPVSAILEKMAGGLSSKQVIDAFPSLMPEDVQAALSYAAERAHEEPR